ncbi:hypothetical protein FACS1894147_05920 [Spirochaetia bacterium]|nr:hypothetical protein FACS1894147_05920 [Spirochaetia bacterium]
MKKVVVTGMGVISPIGKSTVEFSRALKEGKSGVGKITAFDTTGFDVTIAGEVKDFDPSLWLDKKDARKMARFTQFAVAAAAQALDQAKLVKTLEDGGKQITSDPELTGIVLGNGIGGFEIVSEAFRKLFDAGPRRMPPPDRAHDDRQRSGGKYFHRFWDSGAGVYAGYRLRFRYRCTGSGAGPYPFGPLRCSGNGRNGILYHRFFGGRFPDAQGAVYQAGGYTGKSFTAL